MAAPHRRNRYAVAAIAVFVTGAVVMWTYAFFFAPRTSPDKVPDRAWAASAQQICIDARARMDALPPAQTFAEIEPLVEALRQRAVVLDQANAIFADQIARLKALVPADAETERTVQQWLTDLDIYLADRQRHSGELMAGEDTPFTESTHKGSPMSNRMNAFARVNEMPRCQTPQDLA